MPTLRLTEISTRARLAVAAAFGVVVTALVAIPVLAEISPNAEVTWGVYGLDTSTETDAIASQVWAIEQIGDTIYVGGKFLEARQNSSSSSRPQPYLAAFNASTGAFVDAFRPDLESAVYSLQASPDGSRLFVGGEFRSIDGDTEAHGLAALDPATGAVDTTWRAKATNTSGARGVVFGMDVHGDHLYLSGRFDQVGSGAGAHSTEKVGRVALADGATDTTLTTDIEGGSVWGIGVNNDASRIYLAGYHDSVDGDTAGADYSVLTNTGSLIADRSDIGGNSSRASRWYGQDVVVTDNLVFWGGSEHIVRVFAESDGSLVREHSTKTGGDYQDLEVVGDRVYGSCHCYTVHAADFDGWGHWGNLPADVLVTPIKYVAAYSATTGAYIPEFQLDMSATQAGVWAIHGAADGCLWVGGDLSRVTTIAGNDRAAGGFAKFCEGTGTDNRAPDMPPNLVQTREERTKIVLRWDKADDNLGTALYEVSRGGEVIAEVETTGSGKYWFTDSGLEEQTLYSYSVVAIDAAGNRSEPAEIEAGTTGAVAGGDTEAPTEPTALTQTRAEKTKIVLRWNASTDNLAVQDYEVSRDGVAVGLKTAGSANQYWFTDSDLEPGTTYAYEVVARDAAANRSEPAVLEVTTEADADATDTEAPTTPSDLNQTRTENAKIVIQWTRSTDNVGVTSYEVTRDGEVVGTKDAGSSTFYWFTDSGLTTATAYEYGVVAVDAAGNRSPAATLSAGTTGAATGQAPEAPTGLRTTNQTRDRIVLNWEAPTGAAGYVIERDSGDGQGFVEVGTKTSRWFTNTGLTADTAYVYRVVAVGGDGLRSAPSDALSVSTLP
ncbi:MAG: fibronectin type III domain-containing protein [Actinomycetota bacterium]